MQAPLRFSFVFIFFLFFNFFVTAQDKIYLTSGDKECQITDISPSGITYLPVQSSKSVTKDLKKVVLIFNDKGAYLVPSEINFTTAEGKGLVKQFLNHDAVAYTDDLIFKADNSLVHGTINKEDKNAVYLTSGTVIEKKLIAAIIYKNGTHQIIGSASSAAEILWALKSNTASPAKQTVTTIASQLPAKTPTITNDSPKNITPVKNTAPPLVPQQVPETPVNNPIPPPPTAFDKESFQKKADDKIKQFTAYVKIILDRSNDPEKVNKAIDQCLSLFVNENAIVEVSSLKREPVKRRIPEYLIHIKQIKYDKVEVVWRNVSYVTDIQPGPDGNYYGNITFEQEFKGYKDGMVVYQDVTTKKADVALKTYKKTVDGKTQTLWDVFISNIGVESTKSL